MKRTTIRNTLSVIFLAVFLAVITIGHHQLREQEMAQQAMATVHEKEQAAKDAKYEELKKEALELEGQYKALETDRKKLLTELQAKDVRIRVLEKKLKAATATKKSTTPSRGSSPNYKEFYVKSTAYVALCDTGCSGTTKTGIDLLKNPDAKVIAVDPRVIPLGSKVWVEGYGYAIAADTGGAIKGYKIDVYHRYEHDAWDWGVRKVKIRVYNM